MKVLFIVGNKDGRTLLFKMQFDEGRFDTNQTFVTCLDFRLTEADCTRTYDSAANQTTIVTPFILGNTRFSRGAQAVELNILSFHNQVLPL